MSCKGSWEFDRCLPDRNSLELHVGLEPKPDIAQDLEATLRWYVAGHVFVDSRIADNLDISEDVDPGIRFGKLEVDCTFVSAAQGVDGPGFHVNGSAGLCRALGPIGQRHDQSSEDHEEPFVLFPSRREVMVRRANPARQGNQKLPAERLLIEDVNQAQQVVAVFDAEPGDLDMLGPDLKAREGFLCQLSRVLL